MRKILLVFMAILAAAQISAAEYAIVGSFTNPSWNFDASRAANGVLSKNADGKYETTIENLATGFKIVDIENNKWDVQYGAPSVNDMVEIGKTFSLEAKTETQIRRTLNLPIMLRQYKTPKSCSIRKQRP